VSSPADHYRGLIEAAGEDPERPGLAATPERAARAWAELTSGYSADPELTVFPSQGFDQIVAVRDLPFHSLCEHHLLPFHGHAHVAYLPGEQILGLSKFARVLEVYARRLQVQEQLTHQVAKRLIEVLAPAGLIVVVEAEHSCMTMRGVQKLGSRTRTSYASGAFRENADSRAEALALLSLS